MTWPLSNFIELEHPIIYGSLKFYSVEAFYQAMKTTDPNMRFKISQMSPAQSKRAGSKLKLRPDWENIKVDVMELGLRKRFFAGSKDANMLMATKGEIVEITTWHDQIWGRCTCPKHDGQGQNLLGILLMKLRRELLVKEGFDDGFENSREMLRYFNEEFEDSEEALQYLAEH